MKYYLAFFFLIAALSCFSQKTEKHEFTVDRPGVADTPYLVGSHVLQFENGFDYFKTVHYSELFYPAVMMRKRINKISEVRITYDYEPPSNKLIETDFVTNSSILGIGGKLKIIDNDKIWEPDFAIMADVLLPYEKFNTIGKYSPGFDVFLLFQNNFKDHISLNYNVGYIRETKNLGNIFTYSVCLNYQFTPKLGSFIEQYAYFVQSEKPEMAVDGGLTYLLHSHVQLDLSAGISNYQNKPSYFIGTGLSFAIRY